MNPNEYTDRHTHPRGSHAVELVAYERKDGFYDLFAFEPPGACPELEEQRVDNEHILVARSLTQDEIDTAASEVDKLLGSKYDPIIYFQEVGGRRMVGKIHSHLVANGARRVWVRSTGNNDWEIVIRRKDAELAGQVVPSNTEASGNA
jgi:hypothetical protein